MTLYDIILADRKKFNPDIKDSSVKMYCYNITKLSKMLNDGKFVEGYDWLKDFDNVKAKLNQTDENGSSLHFSSVRNYINSAMIYLHCFDEPQLLNQYTMYRDELTQKYDDMNASGTWSEKQGKNAITMEELHKLISEVGNEIKFKKLKEKAQYQPLNVPDRGLVQLYMILSVHAVFPMRNDLAMMKIIKNSQYKGLTDDQKKDNNYLVLAKDMFFVMNDYKTSKTYKEKIIVLPPELRRMMRWYLKLLPTTEYLLTKADGDAVSKNGLSQILTKGTRKRIGKSISTTLLRKVYLTDKYSDFKEELLKDNHNMMHDASTALKIYVKKDPDKSNSEE
jgi:hypothetical protein